MEQASGYKHLAVDSTAWLPQSVPDKDREFFVEVGKNKKNCRSMESSNPVKALTAEPGTKLISAPKHNNSRACF